jgi:serine/threonine protein kinase
MTTPAQDTSSVATGVYHTETLRIVKNIMVKHFRMTSVSIRPVDVGVSRLSIPLKITGKTKRGKRIHYFGKVISNSDMLTDRSIQLLKNVYLQIHAQTPLFGIFESTEEMIQEHFERLQAIYHLGIPTARPYGYYWVKGPSWLLVTEFLDAKPISLLHTIEPPVVSTVFRYLHTMHHRHVFHGDLKPDNIMIDDDARIYLLDIGHLRTDVPTRLRQAYDLACLLCCFLAFCPIEDILTVARKYYRRQSLAAAASYIELVQMRPDIHFSDETKKKLLQSLSVRTI